MRRAVCAWILFAACVGSPGPGEVSVETAVARIRAALGSDALFAREAGVRVTGTCLRQGVEGEFTLAFHPSGSFVQRVHSRLPEELGFDGDLCWAVGATGIARELAFGARAEGLAWLSIQTGMWLDREQPMFFITVDEVQSNGRELALALRARDAPYAATLLVDRRTWRPSALLTQRAGATRRTAFGGWTTALGFAYPGDVVVTGLSGEVSRFSVAAITGGEVGLSSAGTSAFDSTFEAGVPASMEVCSAPTGQLLVRPLLDGADVGWFLLDSGAGAACVTPALADQLGMRAFGEVTVVGVGGTVASRYREGAALRVGPLGIPHLDWLELDLQDVEARFGMPLAGVLGYDVFARAVVVVDVTGAEVELHDSAQFELAGGEWLPLLFEGHTPCVEAGLEGGRKAWFRLDTGSDDTVTFHAPFTRESGLRAGRELTRARSRGIGGGHRADRGTLEWFELAGRRFVRPQVTFAREAAGAFGTPYTAGTIGTGFLREFRLAFDYANARIGFIAAGDGTSRGEH